MQSAQTRDEDQEDETVESLTNKLSIVLERTQELEADLARKATYNNYFCFFFLFAILSLLYAIASSLLPILNVHEDFDEYTGARARLQNISSNKEAIQNIFDNVTLELNELLNYTCDSNFSQSLLNLREAQGTYARSINSHVSMVTSNASLWHNHSTSLANENQRENNLKLEEMFESGANSTTEMEAISAQYEQTKQEYLAVIQNARDEVFSVDRTITKLQEAIQTALTKRVPIRFTIKIRFAFFSVRIPIVFRASICDLASDLCTRGLDSIYLTPFKLALDLLIDEINNLPPIPIEVPKRVILPPQNRSKGFRAGENTGNSTDGLSAATDNMGALFSRKTFLSTNVITAPDIPPWFKVFGLSPEDIIRKFEEWSSVPPTGVTIPIIVLSLFTVSTTMLKYGIDRKLIFNIQQAVRDSPEFIGDMLLEFVFRTCLFIFGLFFMFGVIGIWEWVTCSAAYVEHQLWVSSEASDLDTAIANAYNSCLKCSEDPGAQCQTPTYDIPEKWFTSESCGALTDHFDTKRFFAYLGRLIAYFMITHLVGQLIQTILGLRAIALSAKYDDDDIEPNIYDASFDTDEKFARKPLLLGWGRQGWFTTSSENMRFRNNIRMVHSVAHQTALALCVVMWTLVLIEMFGSGGKNATLSTSIQVVAYTWLSCKFLLSRILMLVLCRIELSKNINAGLGRRGRRVVDQQPHQNEKEGIGIAEDQSGVEEQSGLVSHQDTRI